MIGLQIVLVMWEVRRSKVTKGPTNGLARCITVYEEQFRYQFLKAPLSNLVMSDMLDVEVSCGSFTF
jgi:hypothetical protein